MAEVVQENQIQAATQAEFLLGLAGVAGGFIITRFVNATAGTVLVIFGALVAAL